MSIEGANNLKLMPIGRWITEVYWMHGESIMGRLGVVLVSSSVSSSLRPKHSGLSVIRQLDSTEGYDEVERGFTVDEGKERVDW